MSADYRRGFKEETKAICFQVRRELGLSMTEKLDPWALARHLDIAVIPLSAIRARAPFGCHHFLHVDQSAFSALTAFRGTERIVVHNDAHTLGRQASDVAHEVAHGLLMHPPSPALDCRGCRHWDPRIEREAEWLAGVLLIPEEAAILTVRREWELGEASTYFGVSDPFMARRLNVTNARIRVERAAKKYGASR